jgi:serine/threonine protein kinase
VTALLELEAGERRLGAFRLERQLGHGGFAPVWLAREVYGSRELRTAAVKIFPLGKESQREHQERGARARALHQGL